MCVVILEPPFPITMMTYDKWSVISVIIPICEETYKLLQSELSPFPLMDLSQKLTYCVGRTCIVTSPFPRNVTIISLIVIGQFVNTCRYKSCVKVYFHKSLLIQIRYYKVELVTLLKYLQANAFFLTGK